MLRAAIALYVFLIPLATVLEELRGVDTVLKPYRVAGVAALVMVLLAVLSRGTRLRLDDFDRCHAWILLVSVAGFAFWKLADGTVDAAAAQHYLLLWVFGLTMCIVIKHELRSRTDPTLYMSAFISGLVVSMLLTDPAAGGRYAGLSGNPNTLALVAGASLHFILALFLFGRQRHWAFLTGLAITACYIMYGLLMTGSRGGLVGLLAGGVAWVVIFHYRERGVSTRRRMRLWAMRLIPGLVIALVGLQLAKQVDNTYSMSRYSVDGDIRSDLWLATLDMTFDHYLIGIGPGQVPGQMPTYGAALQEVTYSSVETTELGSHNEYLRTFAEAGVIGLALLLLSFGLAIRNLIARAARTDLTTPLELVAMPILAMLIAGGMGGNLAASPAFWFLGAAVGAVAFRPSRYAAPLPQRAHLWETRRTRARASSGPENVRGNA